jgi:hypothetical protein
VTAAILFEQVSLETILRHPNVIIKRGRIHRDNAESVWQGVREKANV